MFMTENWYILPKECLIKCRYTHMYMIIFYFVSHTHAHTHTLLNTATIFNETQRISVSIITALLKNPSLFIHVTVFVFILLTLRHVLLIRFHKTHEYMYMDAMPTAMHLRLYAKMYSSMYVHMGQSQVE